MRLTTAAHRALSRQLRPGDTAIDATAGNGHDTARLAELTSPGGSVFAIDIQPEALAATRRRLHAEGLGEVCTLICGNHAEELAKLRPGLANRAAAAVFNLGFLPGGDHTIRTRPDSTLAALDQAGELLRADGLLAVIAYRGHPGGAAEARAVSDWMLRAVSRGWRANARRPPARPPNRAPVLWLARKVAFGDGGGYARCAFHATQSA